jgi:cytochrome c biogenesis protein CcmG/thiol:disulfide interchange protein DsbE
MAKSNDFCVDLWVDERLATLEPSDLWRPDASQALQRLRQRASHPGPSTNWKWAAALATLTIVGICLVAFPAPRVFAHYCLDCSVALLQSLSSPSSIHPELAPEANRKTAPDFALQDASGQQLRLSAFRGKVVLLDFWATWCQGCATEIPWFVEFAGKYKDRGLSVIGVSLDADGWKAVKPYIAKNGVDYPIVIGDDSLANLYKVTAMPVTLLIDQQGRIAATHEGVFSKDTYSSEIEKLLATEPAPAETHTDQ